MSMYIFGNQTCRVLDCQANGISVSKGGTLVLGPEPILCHLILWPYWLSIQEWIPTFYDSESVVAFP